ncbi:MAG: hypothetical protein KGZ25_00605 [Planctomycetes bacterium]|nr:hypothetical protein [Planctomycetota bacterium]
MAKSDELTGFHKKRKVLFGEKSSDEDLHEMGRQFMEAEHYDDALEFFARTEAEEDVRKIASRAIENGNTPLFLRAKVVLDEKPTEEELGKLAANAEEAEQISSAYVAHLKASNDAELEKLSEKLPGRHLPGTSEEKEDEEANQ